MKASVAQKLNSVKGKASDSTKKKIEKAQQRLLSK